MSPFVLQMDRSEDCFIKCPVFCRAPLPLPLLEINMRVVVGDGLACWAVPHWPMAAHSWDCACPMRAGAWRKAWAMCWQWLGRGYFITVSPRRLSAPTDAAVPQTIRCTWESPFTPAPLAVMAGINHGCSRWINKHIHQRETYRGTCDMPTVHWSSHARTYTHTKTCAIGGNLWSRLQSYTNNKCYICSNVCLWLMHDELTGACRLLSQWAHENKRQHRLRGRNLSPTSLQAGRTVPVPTNETCEKDHGRGTSGF